MPDVLDAGIDVLLGKVRFLLGGGGGGGWPGYFTIFLRKKSCPNRKREMCLW